MGWGPDYGPWTYHILSEPYLSSELSRLSHAASIGNADCVTFQPCPDQEQSSQDRYVVQEWQLSNGSWRMIAVFDGHAGHETVDHAVGVLPSLLKSSLASALSTSEGVLHPEAVSDVLVKGISAFDDSITSDFLDLFSGGPDALSKYSDDEIRDIINDSQSGGRNSAKVLRCMRGSTVLISLIDPSSSQLWVASLGDCQAVLGFKELSCEWKALILSSNHNGKDPSESDRVRSQHPGEDECILRDRVLGAIAVTRAFGDHLFKLPKEYTERVFLNSDPGFRLSSRVNDFLERNKTPPYMSSQADIRYVDIRTLNKTTEPFLILCSDGLMDLFNYLGSLEDMAQAWVQLVGERKDSEGHLNMALQLLREGLGGEDVELVSRTLTVEMVEKFMDDTTVIVVSL